MIADISGREPNDGRVAIHHVHTHDGVAEVRVESISSRASTLSRKFQFPVGADVTAEQIRVAAIDACIHDLEMQIEVLREVR